MRVLALMAAVAVAWTVSVATPAAAAPMLSQAAGDNGALLLVQRDGRGDSDRGGRGDGDRGGRDARGDGDRGGRGDGDGRRGDRDDRGDRDGRRGDRDRDDRDDRGRRYGGGPRFWIVPGFFSDFRRSCRICYRECRVGYCPRDCRRVLRRCGY